MFYCLYDSFKTPSNLNAFYSFMKDTFIKVLNIVDKE